MVNGLWVRSATDEVLLVAKVRLRPGRARCRFCLVGYLGAGLKLLGPGAEGVGRMG